MHTRLCHIVLLPALLLIAGIPLAHADIYTWVDAAGVVNVSNLAPPDGVHVSRVMHESPTNVAPRPDAALDAAREAAHQADMQALADRIKQLEQEVALARSVPALPPPTYAANAPVTVVPYMVDGPPPSTIGCNLAAIDCGTSWGPMFYPAGIVILRTVDFRRSPRFHEMRRVVMQRPARPPGNAGFRMR